MPFEHPQHNKYLLTSNKVTLFQMPAIMTLFNVHFIEVNPDRKIKTG